MFELREVRVMQVETISDAQVFLLIMLCGFSVVYVFECTENMASLHSSCEVSECYRPIVV